MNLVYHPSRVFQFSSVAHRVWLFVTPWTAARQACCPSPNSWSLLKLISIESVMPSSDLILCPPLLLLPPTPPSIRVFSNESTLCMRWPKYWSFSFSISPSNEHPGLISFRLVGSPWSPRNSQESSPAPQFKTIKVRRAAMRRYPSSKVRSSGCALLEQP